MDSLKVSGPYKATQLWNEMVQTFRGGMPLKKHRRHMKVYENCFTGLEAVSWLLAALQRNPNIGPGTTKDQITQLLNKFLIARVFKRVNLSLSDSYNFKENSDIYEFCSKSLLNGVPRPPLSSTSFNIPFKYRYEDQYQIASKNGLGANSVVFWKQDPAKSTVSIGNVKKPNSVFHDNMKVPVYSNKSAADIRQPNGTRLGQTQGIGIENIPAASSQVRFAGIQQNPCNPLQGKPGSLGSKTHQNNQQPELHGNWPRTQHNTSGYDQVQNFYSTTHQYDPSNPKILAQHGQRSNHVKHLKPLSAQHEQGRGQLKYSQHGMGNCDVLDLHLVTAQHDCIQGLQHENSCSQYQDSSSSARPHPMYKNSHEKGCSQSTEMHKCQFQESEYKYYTTNRLGSPKLQHASHVPDNIEVQKLYPMQKKHTFPKSKCRVDYNQHFFNDPSTEHPLSYSKSYDSSGIGSGQPRVSEYLYQHDQFKNSVHGSQCDQYLPSQTSKTITRNGVDNKYILEKPYRTSDYPMWTNSSHSVTSTNPGQCGNVKTTLTAEKLNQQRSNNSNSKSTEITKPSLMQVLDSCNGVAQIQPTSCSSTEEYVFRLEDIWKTVVISRLQELVTGLEISALLPANLPGEWLLVNGTQPEIPLSQLPQQCLSVLNYLLIDHQGIPEEAVYAVKEYFCNLNEPLTTYELYNILAHTFVYVEYVNNIYHSQVQNYEEILPSQSVENLVLGMASPCVTKPNHFVEDENTPGNEHLVSGSMLLSTVLPPNSCFETAFTSDSPITRIVPQRTMDTLHFKRNVVTSVSARSIKSVEHCSRERRPSLHLGVPASPASTLKRNASAPNLLDAPCVTRSKSTRASNKRTAIKEKSWWHSRKLREIASQNTEVGLQHCRNKSGGYVNPALSLDDADGDLASQELDYAAALETLSKLMQCSRTASEVVGVCMDSSSDCSSSYYTAASSSANSSCQMLADFPETNTTKCVEGEQWTHGGESLGVALLQLLLLMIPPCNRTQLQLLLRFLSQLSSGADTCYSLWDPTQIAAIFSQTIMRSANNAEFDSALTCRMVTFLVGHYDAIMQVPSDLQAQVQHEAKKVQQQLNQAHLTYCEQVSCQQFEQQKLTGSQLALSELLDQILADRKMGLKEKKKRMKMFKESYPHIYRRRFPDTSKEEKTAGEKPRGMLHFVALSRLKSLRV